MPSSSSAWTVWRRWKRGILRPIEWAGLETHLGTNLGLENGLPLWALLLLAFRPASFGCGAEATASCGGRWSVASVAPADPSAVRRCRCGRAYQHTAGGRERPHPAEAVRCAPSPAASRRRRDVRRSAGRGGAVRRDTTPRRPGPLPRRQQRHHAQHQPRVSNSRRRLPGTPPSHRNGSCCPRSAVDTAKGVGGRGRPAHACGPSPWTQLHSPPPRCRRRRRH